MNGEISHKLCWAENEAFFMMLWKSLTSAKAGKGQPIKSARVDFDGYNLYPNICYIDNKNLIKFNS